jgi:ubiquinone biosynthesis protein UbiJ
MRALIEKNLQTFINRYLHLDPESERRLQILENKIVQIHLQGLELIFQLQFVTSKVIIKTTAFNEYDTLIRGTPFTFVHMLLDKNNRQRFFADDVSIEGNIELGQRVIELFDALAIDWEEYISQWVGDVPAEYVGRFGRKVLRAGLNFKKTMRDSLKEYLQEELQIFPQSEALQDFFADVDTLRLDVDRLEARLNLLEKFLEKGKS